MQSGSTTQRSQDVPRIGPYRARMRSSSVRIIATFGLLLALAASDHWIGAGPDPAPSSHHAASHTTTQVSTTGRVSSPR